MQSFSKTREGGESSSGTCTIICTSVQNNYDLRPVNFSFVAIAQDQQAEQLPVPNSSTLDRGLTVGGFVGGSEIVLFVVVYVQDVIIMLEDCQFHSVDRLTFCKSSSQSVH